MRIKRTSGVYAIVSPSGRRYVGSSVNIESRWYDHRYALERGAHHCRALQRAVNKYGLDRMQFIVLESCSPMSLIDMEQRYIDAFRIDVGVYNSNPTAGSRLGSTQSEATRKKLRAIVSEQWLKPETLAARRSKLRVDNPSGYVGVTFNKNQNKWVSRVTVDKTQIYIGAFDTAEEAAQSRIAYLNDPSAGRESIMARRSKPIASNTSGFSGVVFNKKKGRKNGVWMAKPNVNGRQKYIGSFRTAEEANAAILTYRKDPAAWDAAMAERRTKPISSNTSGFTGVTFHKGNGRWVAQPVINGKQKRIGYFHTPEEANAAILALRERLAELEKEAA